MIDRTAAAADVLSVGLMAVALGFAVWRPRGLPEAVVAVPAAVAAVVLGLVGPAAAIHEVRTLGPTVTTLAALFVLAHCSERLGVFRWLAASIGRVGAARGPRLFGVGFAAAAVTTALLNLDAAVVLLTPVLIAMTRSLRVSPQPLAYATIGLANSASTLMPVSNLTNLLAFSASGLGFVHFTGLMALPWVAGCATQYVVTRAVFRGPIAQRPRAVANGPAAPAPVGALATLAATLVGFAVSSQVGLEPVWFAVAGAAALAGLTLWRRVSAPAALTHAIDPPFLAFVLALGVLVAAIATGGIGRWLSGVLPEDTGLPALLAIAAVGAVTANVINNIPATLLLLSALGAAAPAAVLAMLIGVNIGSNLTYVGSLANLLWRNIVRRNAERATVRRFTLMGALAVPAGIVASTTALWLVT